MGKENNEKEESVWSVGESVLNRLAGEVKDPGSRTVLCRIVEQPQDCGGLCSWG